MPTHCCVPECNQKVSFFEFPNQPLLRKKWIHAIPREEGKNWHITGDTNVCCLHFRREDLRKSLAGRTYVVQVCVPSRFASSVPSPRKRKAPTERLPLPVSSKKQLFNPTVFLILTSRLQLLKVQMKYFPVQVEPTN